MTLRLGLWTTLGLLVMACSARAQTRPVVPLGTRPPQQPQYRQPAQVPVAQRRAVGPDQPIVPQQPMLQRRQPAPPTVPQVPPRFQLTLQQQAELDRVLADWEQRSARVKTFECNFTRWEYDPVNRPQDTQGRQGVGSLKYSAPDRGMFRIDGEYPERWIADGKAIFEYKYDAKQVVEHRLPPEMQGKAIDHGPLPFLFGAKSGELKKRYYLRIATPADIQGQVWLEAWPRFQRDAADFRCARLVLDEKRRPYAMETYAPNGKNHTAYRFYDIKVNDPLSFLRGFPTTIPFGWKKIVNEAPPALRVSQRPMAPATR